MIARMPTLRRLGLILLFAAAPLQAQDTNRTLKFLCPSPIIISGASDSGSTVVQLTNDGTDPVDLALTSQDFKSDITGQYLGAQVSFAGSDGKPLPTPGTLKHGEFLLVKVSATNVWQAGPAEAFLYNGGTQIGTVTALKYHFPFAVSLDLPNPAAPKVTAIRDRELFLPFKNADAMTYPVGWRLIVDGSKVAGGQFTLAPKATLSEPVKANAAWFPSDLANRVLSALKPREVNGRIELCFLPQAGRPEDNAGNSQQDSFDRALAAGGGLYPTASIPVKVRLHYWPDQWQSLWGYGLIILIVLAGSLTSVLSSYGIPNVLSRLDLKEKLALLGRRAAAISAAVDSRLRVQLGTQRQQISDATQSRYWFSPDQPETIKICAADLAALEKRVELTEDLDFLRQRYEALIARNMPPTLRLQADAELQVAADLITGPRSGADAGAVLDKAREVMDSARTTIDHFGQAVLNKTFTAELVAALNLGKRLDQVRADFAQLKLTPSSATDCALCKPIQDRFLLLLASIDPHGGDTVSDPEELKILSYYFHQDFQILKLELLRDYAQLYAQLDPAARDKDWSESHLLDLLDGDCWGDLQAARLLLSAMQCNIDCSQLKSAVEKGQFEIVADRPVLERNQAVRFSVKFRDPELNLPAALEQLDYQWKFIHPQWDRRFDRRMRSWWVRGWQRGFSRSYVLLSASAVIGALLVAALSARDAALTFFETLAVWLILAIVVFAVAWRAFGRSDGDSPGGGTEDETRGEKIVEGGKSVWFAWHYFPNAYQYVVRIAISGATMGEKAKPPEPGKEAATEAGREAEQAERVWRCPSDEKDTRFNQKPFRCEFDVKVEESKPMQRAGAEFLRFLLAFGAALITLIVGARAQIVKLDLAAAIAALWTLGFTSDAMKNLISQGPAASVASAKRADAPSSNPPGKSTAAASSPGPVTPRNGGSKGTSGGGQAQGQTGGGTSPATKDSQTSGAPQKPAPASTEKPAPTGDPNQQNAVIKSPAKPLDTPAPPATPPAADLNAEREAKQETEIPVTVRPLEIQFDKGPSLVDPNLEKIS